MYTADSKACALCVLQHVPSKNGLRLLLRPWRLIWIRQEQQKQQRLQTLGEQEQQRRHGRGS